MMPSDWWMQQASGQSGGALPQGGGLPPPLFGDMPMGTQTSIPPPPQVPPAPPAGPMAPVGGVFGGSGLTQQPAPSAPPAGPMAPSAPNPQRDMITQSLMQQQRPGYGGY